MIGILKHRQINCPRLQTSSVWWRYNLNPECLKPMSISLTYLRYVSRKNTFANHVHWHRWHLIISITSLCLPINRTVDIYIQSVHFCQINGRWSCRNHLISGFPHGSHHKESACNVGDLGLIPGLVRSPGEGNGSGLVRSPGEGNGLSLQSCSLENSMDYIITKSGTWLSDFHFHVHSYLLGIAESQAKAYTWRDAEEVFQSSCTNLHSYKKYMRVLVVLHLQPGFALPVF